MSSTKTAPRKTQPPRSATCSTAARVIRSTRRSRRPSTAGSTSLPKRRSRWPASSIAKASLRRREKVCRANHRSAARPTPMRTTFMGVTLNALGTDEGSDRVASSGRSKLAPKAASIHANLGEVLRQAGQSNGCGQVAGAGGQARPEERAGAEQSRHHPLREEASSKRRSTITAARSPSARTWRRRYNNLGNALAHGRRRRRRDARLSGSADPPRESIPRPTTISARCCSRTSQLEEAEHALKKAIAQNPRYVEAHNNLAAALFRAEEGSRCAADSRRCAEVRAEQCRRRC